MKKKLLFSLLLAFIYSSSLFAQSWPVVGAKGFTTNPVYFPSTAIDTAGTIYVSYVDNKTAKVNVIKYVGTAWGPAGNVNLSTDSAAFAALALSKKGAPYVVYSDGSGKNTLHGAATVMQLSGAAWVPVGNPFFSAQPVAADAIAIDTAGIPYVAYIAIATKSVIIEKFVQGTWVPAGTGGNFPVKVLPGNIVNLSLAIGANNSVYVAYNDTLGNGRVTVKKLSGTSWVNVGSAGISPLPVASLSIATDPSGLPYLAYSGLSSPYSGACVKFNGTAWLPVGATGLFTALPTPVTLPSILITKAGVPVVSFGDGSVGGLLSVKQFIANNWVNTAPPGISQGVIYQSSLALTKAGVPYVAYRDTANGNRLTVLRYDSTPVAVTNNIITAPKDTCGKVDSIAGLIPKGGNGVYTYVWKSSVNKTAYTVAAGQTGASLVFKPALLITQNTYFIRIVTVGALPYTSDTVVFYAKPTASSVTITSSPSTLSFCAGTKISFTATPVNGGVSPTYIWKKNNIKVGTNSSIYIDSTLKTADVVTCVLRASNTGCIVGDSSISNKITVGTVIPLVTPTVSIATNLASLSFCAKTKVTFTATAAGASAFVYQWKKDNNIVGTNSATYIDSTLKSSDSIKCTVTATGSCLAVNSSSSNTVKIGTVTPLATPTVTIATNLPVVSFCAKTKVTFTATAAGASVFVYQWKKDNIVVGTNSATYIDSTLKSSDSVKCTVTATGSCLAATSAVSNTVKIGTVTPLATPTVSISPNLPVASICAKTKVTFTATAAGASVFVYQWKKDNIVVGTNSATYIDSALNSSDSIICMVTATGSCLAANSAVSSAIKIGTVSPPIRPTISIAYTVPVTLFCANTKVSFTATATNVTNVGAVPVYLWKRNNIIVGTSSTTYIDSAFNTSDAVICTLKVPGGCVTVDSVVSNKLQIGKVYPVLVPWVGITVYPKDTICLGSPAKYAATQQNGGATPTYQWIKNGVSVGSTNLYTDSDPHNNDKIMCVLTSNAVCATPVTATAAVTITGDPATAPTLSISASSGAYVCPSTNSTFTAKGVYTGNASFQWVKNSVNVGKNSQVYIDNSLKANDTVKCVMNDTTPCGRIYKLVSSNIVVTAAVNPTVNISVLPRDTICLAQPATYTATAVNGGGNPTYQWVKNGVNVGIGTYKYIDSMVRNKDVVKCKLGSSMACATPSVTSNAISISLDSIPAPTISITASTGTVICAGTKITFTAKATYKGKGTYQWKKGSANVGANSPVYVDSTLKVTDTIVCQIIDTTACKWVYIKSSNPFIVVGRPSAVTKIDGPISLSAGISGNYVADIYDTAYINAETYTWTMPANSVAVTGQGTRFLTMRLGSTGNLSVVASNNCGTSPSFSMLVTLTPPTTGTIDLDKAAVAGKSLVAIYPNPAKDVVKINFTALTNGKYNVEVIDATGKVLSAETIQAVAGPNSKDVSLHNLAQGIYYIRLSGKDHEHYVAKVVKQN